MSRTPSRRSGSPNRAVACLGALVVIGLAGCAPSPTAPSTSPTTPEAPAASTPIEPSATATGSDAAPTQGEAFETQDGAMRMHLPQGWSVDDRSAMGEASEMYNRGPGWLNDLTVLDESGDPMIWYREYYGNDFIDCRPAPELQLDVEVEPYAPELLAEFERAGIPLISTRVTGQAADASTWDGLAEPGMGAAAVGMVNQVDYMEEGCSGLTEILGLGTRIAQIDVVGDAPSDTGEPDTTVDFPTLQSAQAWLDSDEVSELVDVLSTVEFTGAPVLDAAP